MTETVESVLAEMRKETEPLLWPIIRKFADRLAAAHGREVGLPQVEIAVLNNNLSSVMARAHKAEARAEAAEELLREVSRNAWGKTTVEDTMHPLMLLERIDAHLGATND